MSNCLIDLTNIQIEHRKNTIFYASHNVIIFKDRNHLVATDCTGTILSKLPCPQDYYKYDYLELHDVIVFVFAGKTLVVIDKNGGESYTEELPILKIGRSIPRIFPSQTSGSMILPSHLHGKIHFINYDFVHKKRICQTMSWDVSEITDITSEQNLLYALLDKTFIVCCDMTNCETKWMRFETGMIDPKIIAWNSKLFYSCHGILKRTTEKTSEHIRIPTIKSTGIHKVDQDIIYFTANDKKHICAFDAMKNKLLWEITGSEPVQQIIDLKGINNNNIQDIMIVQTKSHISILNLTSGKINTYFRAGDVTNIKITGNHVLIHRQGGRTDMIAGVQK